MRLNKNIILFNPHASNSREKLASHGVYNSKLPFTSYSISSILVYPLQTFNSKAEPALKT